MKNFLLAVVFFALVNCYASTFLFSDISYSSGIPEGWAVDNNYSNRYKPYLNTRQPVLYGGEEALQIVFTSANRDSEMLLTKVDPITDDVDCDNLVFSVTVYVEPKGTSVADSVQPVISVDGGSFVTLGEVIPFKSDLVQEPTWVTYNFSTNIINAASKALKIGLKAIAGGRSSSSGYVKSLSVDYKACTTVKNIELIADDFVLNTLDLNPNISNLLVRAKIEKSPEDDSLVKILENQVTAELQYGSNRLPLKLVRQDDGYWYSEPLPKIDAGVDGILFVSVPYFSPTGVETLAPTNEVGVAIAVSEEKKFQVGKLGSVWINEITQNAIEFCGTTNRIYIGGWQISVSNNLSGVISKIVNIPFEDFNHEFNKTIQKTGGVVGIASITDIDFSNVEYPSTFRLINSSGVIEDEVVLLTPPNLSWSRVNCAQWNEEYKFSYDWTGTSRSDVFNWANVNDDSIGDVNINQGFRTEVEKTIKVCSLPYANITVKVNDFMNIKTGDGDLEKSELAGSDGTALFNLLGWTQNISNLYASISSVAFGWRSDNEGIIVIPRNNQTNEYEVVMEPTTAVDSFQGDLSRSWVNNSERTLFDTAGREIVWTAKNDRIYGRYLSLYASSAYSSGYRDLKCSNSLSPCGKSVLNISFDTKNQGSNFASGRKDEFTVLISTNSTWSGEIISSSPVSDKNPNFDDGIWYQWSNQVIMPEEFANASELWVKLRGTSEGATSSELAIKNLRIAFQDMATVEGLRPTETEIEPSFVEKPSFEIDVKPWCGEGQSVSNVTAQLVMDVNGKVFTNEVEAVNLAEETPFTITNINENLKANVGYAPLRANDKVKYWAQVKYYADSRDPEPAKEWETKFYPDNSKVDSEGRWVVEGEYGVDMAKVNTFTVSGGPITQNEGFESTKSEVSFGVRVFDAAGVSNVVVKVFAEGSEEPIDVRTFDVEGMVTHYDTVINLSGLNSNAKYIVKVSGWNANGEEIAEQILPDSFMTKPKEPIVEITALSTNEVKMVVSGSAAGFEVSDGWTKGNGNAWTKEVDNGANSLVSATVTATNALGGASKSTTAVGYTKASIATMAPVVTTNKNWAIVKACTNHYASVDGNPDYTEYALRVTTSKGGDNIASTNGVEVWKPLADWQNNPERFTTGAIDLVATNTFSFITRNLDGVVTTNDSPATAECWFDMTVSFEGKKATQSDDGSLAFTLNFFDPAQSEEATATIEYMIGDGEWQLIKAPYTVKFDDLEVKEDIVFNAKDLIGDVNKELEYTIRATITDGERSAESTITGRLDFKKPEVLNLSSIPSGLAFNTDKLNVIVAFDEPVVGFSTGSVNVGNATVLTVKPSIVTNVYTVVLKPTAEGVVTVSVPEGRVADIYGNVNLASGELRATYDITEPEVTLTTETPNNFNDATMAVKVVFSEAIVDLTADKISVQNGTVSNLTKLDDAVNTYLATITPNKDGVVSVDIMSGAVKDAAGNGNNESNIITRNYDTTRPTVELSSETSDLFNNTKSPMVVTAKFSEVVVGVNNEAITVENAASYEVSGTNDTYTITIVPEVDGKVVVKIDENKVADLALNGNIASNELVREYDNTSPVINNFATDPADGAETNNKAFNYSVEATDANEITYSWSLITPNGSELKGSEASFSGEAQEEGWYNLSVTVSDAVGNTTSRTARWRYDITAPTVAVTSETLDPFNTSPMTVKVVFSEDVVGFTHEDLDVTNATIDESSLKTIDDGTNTYYLVTLNPVADGEVTLVINEGVATDKAGNNNTAATITRKYDNTKPTVELTSETPNPFNEKSPFVVTATFSEPVTGFNEVSLNVVNASSYTVSGEGDTYTITVEPAANDEITGQAVSVEVLDGVVADAAGNKNDKSATLTRTYDIVKPVVTLTSETPEYFNADSAPMTVKVVFTEAVTNFTWESVSVNNGTVDENSFESVVDGTNTYYLVTVTPVADGEVTLAVNDGVVADSAGNINTSATLTRVYDTVSPAPVLTSITPDPFNDESSPLTVTVTFNESIIGFGETSVKVDNGTINEITGSEAVYTVKVNPPAEDGYVSVFIPSNVVRDAAGNWNTGSEVLTRLYDNARPEVKLTTDTPNPFNAAEEFIVKFAFSEVVTNFTEKLVSVTNGKAISMEPVNDEANSYLVTIEPESDGVVSVEVADGVALDRAGNGNIASAILSRRYDNTRPELTLASESPEYVNAETSPVVFAATFNESITDLLNDGILVDNGEVLEITKSETITNTFVVTLSALNEGKVTVKIAENAVKDMANNSNNASEELSWIYDITRPTVELMSETPNPFNEKSPFVVTAKFSEPITGFNETSLKVDNAASYAVSGEGDTYTITIEPAENGEITGQTVTVEVLDSVVIDAAGNKNVKSAPLTRTYDIVEPDVTLTTETPEDLVFNAAYTYKVTVAFSESVTNFTADTVSVVNGTVSEYSKVEDAENTFIVTIAPEADGEIIVQVNEGVVADAAGNGNNASEILVRKCDITKPVASIKSFAFDPKTVYISFSEDVVGLTREKIIVENGTIDIYRANGENGAIITINSLSDGIVTIKIPEGAVTDKVGNANAAVEAYVNDNTPPTKPIISGSPENGATVNESGFSLKAVATDNSPADMLTYFWSLNGGALVKNKTGILTGESVEGENVVQVYVMDLSGNKSEIASWRWIYEKKTTDVEFGDSVRLAVDPETGATNTVSFTKLELGSDYCTLTLSGFDADSTEILDLEMWLIVSDTIKGKPWYIKVNSEAKFDADKNELIVTIPQSAIKDDEDKVYDSLFFLGVDNSDHVQ